MFCTNIETQLAINKIFPIMITIINNIWDQKWEKLKDYLLKTSGKAKINLNLDLIVPVMPNILNLGNGFNYKSNKEKPKKVMIKLSIKNLANPVVLIKKKMLNYSNRELHSLCMLLHNYFKFQKEMKNKNKKSVKVKKRKKVLKLQFRSL